MRKIKVNPDSLGRYQFNVDVYVDGEKTLRCIEADEAEGVAWLLASETHASADLYAKPGDFVIDKAIVQRVTGSIEIRFKDVEDEAAAREEIAEHYVPCRIIQIVQ